MLPIPFHKEPNKLVLTNWLSNYQNNHKLANILIIDSLSGFVFDLNRIESTTGNSSKYTLNWSEVDENPRFLSVNFNPEKNEFLLNLVIPVRPAKTNNKRVMIFQFDARTIFSRTFAYNPTNHNSMRSFLKFDINPSVLQLDSLVLNSKHFITTHPFPNDFEVSGPKSVTGFISGENESGKSLFGWVSSISKTNWVLILEINQAEVQAGIRDKMFSFIGWGCIWISLLGMIVFLSLSWLETHTQFAFSAIKKENEKLAVRLEEFSRDANVMMWTLDETGRFLDVNEKALEVFGYTRDEFLSIPAVDLRSSHLKENFEREFARAKKQGNLEFKLELKRKDGTTFPAELISKKFEIGNQVIFNTIAFDMTERVQMENQVKRLNRLFRIVTDIDDIILQSKTADILFNEICKAMVTTADFSLVYVGLLLPGTNRIKPVSWMGNAEGFLKSNDSAFFNTSDEEIEYEILPADQQNIRVINSTADPRLSPSERNLMLKSGFQSKCSILVIQNKKVIGALTILSDFPEYFTEEIIEILSLLPERISFSLDAMASEDIRKIQQVKLSESERFYFALFNNNQMPMWIYEEESLLIREVNEAACNRYGYTRDEFLKLSLFDMRPDSEHEKLIETANSPEHNSKWSGPWVHKLKDGSLCNVEVSSQDVIYKNKKCRLVLINDITVKLQSELELKESERRFRLAIDLFPDVFAIYNPDLTYRFINKKMIYESGYLEENILGKTDKDLFPIEMTHVFVPFLEKALSTLDAQSAEVSLKWYGIPHFTRINYIPVLDENKKLEMILCTAIDITTLKMTQSHLEREKFLLNSAQEIGQSGSWEWEKETGIVSWSENLWHLFGLDPHLNSPSLELFYSIIAPEDRNKAVQTISKASADKNPYSIEFKSILPNGRIRYLLSTGRTIQNAETKTIQFLNTVQDITEIREKQQQILDSLVKQKDLQMIIDKSPVTVMLWNQNPENPLYFISEGIRQFGYNPEDLLSNKVNLLSVIHPDDFHLFEEGIKKLVKNPESEVRQEYRIKTSDGEFKWVEAHIWMGQHNHGAGSDFHGILIDINERMKASSLLVKMNEELEDRVKERTLNLELAIKELETFTYSVSHDLRAPLRHIAGFSELVLKNSNEIQDSQIRKYLGIIAGSSLKMGQMMDSLLEFSRTGRLSVSVYSVDLNKIVENCLAEYGEEIERRHVQITIGQMPHIMADDNLMRVVFSNLIGNAIKYSRDTIQAEIDINCDHSNGKLIFSIRDNGMGFEMKYAEKLFGLFQRLHNNPEFEGHGIGLANVKRIVEKHNGAVWAEGLPDKGSIFYFSLPEGCLDEKFLLS
ncbi:MAG: PAS domain S-box protein [Bacteroidetes bacterium]|nr:PAS domain S-box protein [Bacteroidota bacterium]